LAAIELVDREDAAISKNVVQQPWGLHVIGRDIDVKNAMSDPSNVRGDSAG
jgi:hypothetical protein